MSCKEKKADTVCTKENTVAFPKDPVSRFHFKDSSYWIYKDSITGIIDSVWVVTSRIGVDNYKKINPSSDGKCYEGLYVSFSSIHLNEFSIELDPQTSAFGTEYMNERFTIRYRKGIKFYMFTQLKGNSYVNINIGNGVMDSLDFLIVNGTQYSNVLRKSGSQVTNPDLFYKSYYVKEVGLIKYEDYSNHVWELIRYKIKN